MGNENRVLRNIINELKHHSRFTLFGAFTGIILMAFFYKVPFDMAYEIFYVLHPIHIVLSALVTASMYKIHSKKVNPLTLILIGYVGSIGIATLSDSIIPYLGEILLNLPNRGIHLGFIEKWWLVNPLAFLGIAIAYFNPNTKFPHAGHVLLSTWASLFHIIMALGGAIDSVTIIVIFGFLFIAVLIPCCLSDIVFPLLFVELDAEERTK
ncbi:MAG: hypothetical protein KAT28_05355 [Candidatus Aenigmarchaeota archaeon]|nr:hypothetical protein [Candidatus Aenigmarchaeota archaeon]